MTQKRAGISQSDLDVLFLSSVRYALGRCTYISETMADILTNNRADISPWVLRSLKKEIKDAIDKGQAGMSMDIEQWNRILEL